MHLCKGTLYFDSYSDFGHSEVAGKSSGETLTKSLMDFPVPAFVYEMIVPSDCSSKLCNNSRYSLAIICRKRLDVVCL